MTRGKLYVVGLGPGGSEHLTPAARAALEGAEVVVGYRTYLELIPELLAGRQVVSSGMRQELERCRQALALAAAGRRVALVSSGDPGIYGMAGLALELAGVDGPEIEIVPGVSALQAAAARLGAPLMHDFAVISLSDLLTPWAAIRARLAAAARADFVVALYNPKSRGRTGQIEEARAILLRHREPGTPVGIVRHVTRAGESVTLTDLAGFTAHPIDMFSVVLVGNGATFVDGRGRMITPRGYGVSGEERGASGGTSAPFTPRPSSLTAQKGVALFVGGTGSDVGKSVIVAGLCRLLRRRGVDVAPFKAQNMALNAAVTPQGGEIGRAQALQAAACGLAPHSDMNPVLLKPTSTTGSQVIVDGRPVGSMDAATYHAYKPQVFARVEAAFARLAARHAAIVLEGAGSVAEINLMAHDITNLRAAEMADAPIVLVADIDRGGVFASLLGTVELLPETARRRLLGFVINRFRGDPRLLEPGLREIEARTGVPVLGVIPWLDLHLPEEDSVALARKPRRAGGEGVRIGVVRLPHLSNFTDFDPLEQEAGVSLAYLDQPAALSELDWLILPGSKNTLEDLAWLHGSGFAAAILAFHARGGTVSGLCGGYQMLGRRVRDPFGIESERGELAGLGLLDAETVLAVAKTTRRAHGRVLAAGTGAGLPAGADVAGYEIHQGETTLGGQAQPLLTLVREGEVEPVADGAVAPDGRAWGSYLHGLFDAAAVRQALLAGVARRSGRPYQAGGGEGPSLDAELDRLADQLAAHLDLAAIWRGMGLEQGEMA